MPTEMTFQSLQADLQSYLERGASTDTAVYNQLPKLINNAERRIARRLKILGFKVPLTSNFVAGTPVVQKPDRWRQTISWNYGQINANGFYNVRTPLLPRSYEFCRAYGPDDTVTGLPLYYADYDYNNWIVTPTPDYAYPFEINMWQLPALLDTSNTTNWTSTYAPEALLYSALLECEPFLKNDPRIATWKSMYDEAIGNLEQENVLSLVNSAFQISDPKAQAGR